MATEAQKIELGIRNCNLVCVWQWNIQVQTCAICRNNIGDPCIECEANDTYSGKKENEAAVCPRVWGQCNHAFHSHCIQRWLKKTNTCPLDNFNWEFQKTE